MNWLLVLGIGMCALALFIVLGFLLKMMDGEWKALAYIIAGTLFLVALIYGGAALIQYSLTGTVS